MERVYAFTDEYGAYGWNIDNPTVSTCFIITAAIVKESDLQSFENGAESIRKKFFQTGEIKSKNVSKDHARRQKILAEINKLPFQIFSVCVDKKACMENMSAQGLQFKKSFYKFMNNIVHQELRHAFQKLTIVADELIDNDYMQSFCKYVAARQDVRNFFGDAQFEYRDSKNDVRIQIADFISGTLAYHYDTHKKKDSNPNYLEILKDKIISIELYPKSYYNYVFEENAAASGYDIDVSRICYEQAMRFVLKNKNSDDPEVEAQVIVLKYLLFRFVNNDTRGYIYTKELKNQLGDTELADISDSTFRMRVIAKLRDKGVIIASSNKGYKIPSRENELYDYINHDAKVVLPMLERLRKCRNLIKLGTVNGLDLLAHDEYKNLRAYFDSVENI